jgi:hypothetical protein
VITVAYLVRPDGWQSIIAAATPAEPGSRRRSGADACRARRPAPVHRAEPVDVGALGEALAQADAAPANCGRRGPKRALLRAVLGRHKPGFVRRGGGTGRRRREQEVRRVRGQLSKRSVRWSGATVQPHRAQRGRARAALLIDGIAAAAAGCATARAARYFGRPADGVAARSSAVDSRGRDQSGARQLLSLPRAPDRRRLAWWNRLRRAAGGAAAGFVAISPRWLQPVRPRDRLRSTVPPSARRGPPPRGVRVLFSARPGSPTRSSRPLAGEPSVNCCSRLLRR